MNDRLRAVPVRGRGGRMRLAPGKRIGRDDQDDLLGQLDQAVEYAFQPIVDIHSGVVYGFEALLRGHDRLGYRDLGTLLARLFDPAHADAADRILRRKAVARFAEFGLAMGARLFYNVDGRLFLDPAHDAEAGAAPLKSHGLPPGRFCAEISEGEALADPRRVERLLRAPASPMLIAIDDFGTGHSGLRLLSESQPDLIKVDRYFISGIDREQKKKVFLSSIVNLAHILGIKVVAEGIETEAEFRAVREIGCDLAQGYYIARPSTALADLNRRYDGVAALNRGDRRAKPGSGELLRAELDPVRPLRIDAPMETVFEAFRRAKARSFFPVIDGQNQPVGVVHEQGLKEFVYSPFGKDVLANRRAPYKLHNFVVQCLVFDLHSPVERMLEAFALRDQDPAILITENGSYAGLLDAAALIRVVNERNLTAARNQNPLTRLPGNIPIADYIGEAFADETSGWHFAYFDLDDFKPFNDKFGFRQGDRVLLMFAGIMQNILTGSDLFLGHIGGDDFFVGWRNGDPVLVRERLAAVLAKFTDDARSFYDAETRDRGLVEIKDRDGLTRLVPLISASCAVIDLPRGPRLASSDQLGAILAELKSAAKKAPGKLAWRQI